jgi:hypothetical protein
MSVFLDAMQTNDTRTTNGMAAHSTSGSSVLDFFSKSGALRAGKKLNEGLTLFKRAYQEDPLLALKALFYARDIRGGQGERQLFRDCLSWLATTQPHTVVANLGNIAKFGRWDDLKALTNTDTQAMAVNAWARAIHQGDGLASKWMPRKGPWFAWVRKDLGMKCGEFRRLVASQTKVVETHMCNNDWTEINYSHVPSVANTKYLKAFHRHDGVRYREFIAKAVKGEVKINSSALYPADIVKLCGGQAMYGLASQNPTADALWKQLPDWIGGSGQKILGMIDVSGSMHGEPMAVAVSLGLYVSERLTGPFKDVILTFSAIPQFHKVIGTTLAERINNLSKAKWDMNTNLEKALKVMLQKAIDGNVPADEMPTTLLIISDMQFDACVAKPSQNALQMARQAYERSGYQMPKVVFWNVNASKNQPAKQNQIGVALVSGYSPSIMKSILEMKPQATPKDLMLETLNAERYASVVLPQ